MRDLADLSPLVADALEGLRGRPKTLSPKWLYDRRGSELFERITGLPEYYLTRTETALLRAHAAEFAALVPHGGALVEMGSGASVKTRILLDAGRHFGAYVPIDISADFLAATARDLRARYPGLAVHPVAGDFTGPVDLPEAVSALPKVGFFPGSTIGNLPRAEAVALLARARGWDGAEAFLLGADLIKEAETLVAAYDDAQGVTAEFIGNVLVRLNGEGADFDLDAFAYEARWDAARARIDMALVSTRDQVAHLAGEAIGFAAGERIHVSASRKFDRARLEALASDAGWRVGEVVTDAQARFALAVLRP
ncbi:L-histidine N(alpha)-methyltransferase [Jannaschia formosa]|uniref:L-histidine N(alpha)-methyltransferase n=1 Tax=Jannaschia formosa TaxID=2259592 RepID=UPI000E1BF92F|nr:L-histidine N(alpha)-methyltransferase [Jannaschia formosa]TFL19164.1 L-histidine N(alpha)-methyltransferase [Jannaschia formosa]